MLPSLILNVGFLEKSRGASVPKAKHRNRIASENELKTITHKINTNTLQKQPKIKHFRVMQKHYEQAHRSEGTVTK